MAPISETRLRIIAALPAVARDMWVTGECMTNISLARRCEATELSESAKGPRERATTTFHNVLQRLEDDGVLLRQAAPTAGHPEKRTAPASFNWSPLSLAEATLRHALEPYLADPAVPGSRKKDLRSALRVVLPSMIRFPLKRQCKDTEILKAAARLPVTRIHELRRLLVASERLSKGKAEDYRGAVSQLMRYAAARDLIPLCFPPTRADSPWEGYKDQFWPLARRGAVMPAAHRKARQVWDQFTECCQAHAKAEARELPAPEKLTAAEAEAAIQFGGSRLGYKLKMTDMRRLLFTLRDEHRTGPFATIPPNPYVTRSTKGQLSPRFYLRGADGFCASGADWDGLLRIIEENLLQPLEQGAKLSAAEKRRRAKLQAVVEAWREFVRWYRDYSTLDWRVLQRRRADFPSRYARRELDQGTQQKRVLAMRAWLGVALYELKLDPATLSPEAVLGTHFFAIKERLLDLWEARARLVGTARKEGLPCEDRISDTESAGVVHHVLGAGLWALAAYERSRFLRGETVALRGDGDANPDGVRVDALKEMAARKTEAEARLLGAYVDTLAFSDSAEADRLKRKGGLTTAKDLAEIIEKMPADRWVRIHRAMLDDLDRRLARQEGTRLERARLGMDTFYTGFLLSTACRESEAAHVRLDVQLSPRNLAKGLVVWRGIDRTKTEEGHNGVLHATIIPERLLRLVLDEARPYLMRGQWTEKAERQEREALRAAEARAEAIEDPAEREAYLDEARAQAAAEREAYLAQHVQTHTHIFVNEQGAAVGCSGEDVETGAGRDTVAMRVRQGQQSRRWLTTVLPYAVSLDIEVPLGHGELGEHGIRAAVGFAVYKAKGKQAAANLLGNTERVLMQSYAILDARGVDVPALPEFELLAQPSAAVSPPPPDATYASYVEERNGILRDAKSLGLAADIVNDMLREAGARWGITPAAGAKPKLAVVS